MVLFLLRVDKSLHALLSEANLYTQYLLSSSKEMQCVTGDQCTIVYLCIVTLSFTAARTGAYLGYKSDPRTEDKEYSGTRTHDLVVDSQCLNHSAEGPPVFVFLFVSVTYTTCCSSLCAFPVTSVAQCSSYERNTNFASTCCYFHYTICVKDGLQDCKKT